jgi:sugar lactone lactonase YvrE
MLWLGTYERRRPPVRLRTIPAISLAILSGTLLLIPNIALAGDKVEVVVSFDATKGQLPEGVAEDKSGNIYFDFISPVSELRKIAPDGTQTLVTHFPTGGLGPLGLAVDAPGNVYVALTTLDPETAGVYRVSRDGTAERLPGTADILFANGLAFDKLGNLYVTDSIGGAVWKIPPGGSAEQWIQDPQLEGTGAFGLGFPIGANGITFAGNSLVVANTEKASLLRIPIRVDGSAGTPTVIADDPALFGADGLTLDVFGNVYVAVVAQNTIVRVSGDSITTVVDASDGIVGASSLVFGTGRGDRLSLFAVNFGIVSAVPEPALLRIPVGVPGRPVP